MISLSSSYETFFDFDVAILGGGYSGLWTTYYLLRSIHRRESASSKITDEEDLQESAHKSIERVLVGVVSLAGRDQIQSQLGWPRRRPS